MNKELAQLRQEIDDNSIIAELGVLWK